MFIKTFSLVSALLGSLSQSPDPKPVVDAVKSTPTVTRTRVAKATTANAVVAEVQKFYVDTVQLTAKFRQVYKNTTFGRDTKSDGFLYIKKPGKMRWDYKNKQTTTKSFISDGERLWAVEHDNKQVFKKDLEKDLLPVAVTFLTGKGDLRKDFVPALDTTKTKRSEFGVGAGDHLLELTPKTPSAQYKKLWLVVDGDNYRVKQSIVLESSGNTNRFQFFEPNTTKAVSDKLFFFDEAKYSKTYRIVEPDDAKQK